MAAAHVKYTHTQSVTSLTPSARIHNELDEAIGDPCTHLIEFCKACELWTRCGKESVDVKKSCQHQSQTITQSAKCARDSTLVVR